MKRRTAIAALSLLLAARAWAGGFYQSEIGARAIGRGGADVVNPADGYAMWRNPAALANQPGLSLDLDSALIWFNLQFDRSAPFELQDQTRDIGGYRFIMRKHQPVDPSDIGLEPTDDWRRTFEIGKYPSQGSVQNHASPFVAACSGLFGGGFDGYGHCPAVGATLVAGERLLHVRGLTLALGGYGPPGGSYWFWDESAASDPSLPEAERYLDPQGRDRRFTGPQRYALIDRDTLEAFYQLSAAYRINRYLAVGFGLQAIESFMRMRVAVSADTYGTEDINKDVVVSINARQAYLPNANVGFWSNPIWGLELGGSYQLPRRVEGRGPVTVDYMAPGLSDFEVVGTPGQATVRFVMPAIARIGALYRWRPWFDVEADLVIEQWSSWQTTRIAVEGVAMGVGGLDPIPFAPVFQPRHYQDSYSVRLGGDVDPLAAWWPGHLTLRAGYQFETSAIPAETLDTSLVDAPKHILGCGLELGYLGLRLVVAYQHSFLEEVTVDNTLIAAIAPLGDIFGYETRTAVGNGTYRASFDVLAVGLRFDFDQTWDFFTAPAPAAATP
ncbi:MAG: outer membrane protein transport protein [Deltaproteobacteria bacterium]|nr:outer membrane protein transport protein [Deltaproteobacteria bacterium]